MKHKLTRKLQFLVADEGGGQASARSGHAGNKAIKEKLFTGNISTIYTALTATYVWYIST